MATTVVTPVATVFDGGVDEGAGYTIVAADTVKITPSRFNKLLVVLALSVSPAAAVVFKAGVYPPALESGQGDLTVVPLVAGRTTYGPFVGGRFAQSDGSLQITFAGTTAGKLYAYEVTRTSNTA